MLVAPRAATCRHLPGVCVGMESQTWRWTVGVIYIFIVAVIWITASFVVQTVVESGVSPFLITYICNTLFVVYIPGVELAHWLNVSAFAASVTNAFQKWWVKQHPGDGAEKEDEGRLLNHPAQRGALEEEQNALDADGTSNSEAGLVELESRTEHGTHGLLRKATAIVSLIVCPSWFLAQLTNNLSLKYTSVTSNTILSSTAPLFTFLVSLKFSSEKYTAVKLVSVLACMAGTIVVSVADSKKSGDNEAPNPVLGDIFCLVSAFLYAVYTTLIRRLVRPELRTELFFGYLGLFNGLLFLPFLLIVHFTGLEPIRRLTWTQLGLIIGKGLLDNVLSDLLWAKAVLLTSPTAATAGLTIQVPIAVAIDTLKGRLPGVFNLTGGAIVLLGFMGINQPCWAGEAEEEEDEKDVIESTEREVTVAPAGDKEGIVRR